MIGATMRVEDYFLMRLFDVCPSDVLRLNADVIYKACFAHNPPRVPFTLRKKHI